MKIFACVGAPDAVRMELIRKLVGELKSRGYTVAVLKEFVHGFDLGGGEKETASFMEAGSDAVFMYVPDGAAVLRQKKNGMDMGKMARKCLEGNRYILVDGAPSGEKLKKIAVLTKGSSEEMSSPPEDLIAVVSDSESGTDVPMFHPEDIQKIADFLVNQPDEEAPPVRLEIDGVPIPMNPFVQKIFTHTLTGMIHSLEGIPEDPGCISLSLSRKRKKR